MTKISSKLKLDTDERIILITRKHWFILFGKMLGPVLLLLFSLIALPALSASAPIQTIFERIPEAVAIAIFLSSLWFLLLWIVIFHIWTDYYLDIWTITTKRIVAINQRGLFNRHISSFRYERLQDIHVEIIGIIATFLDYGTLKAETAGDSGEKFIFSGAPHPRDIKSKIVSATDALSWKHRLDPPSDDGV